MTDLDRARWIIAFLLRSWLDLVGPYAPTRDSAKERELLAWAWLLLESVVTTALDDVRREAIDQVMQSLPVRVAD